MLIDKENTFSWNQALTGDAISTNVIDLLPNGGAIGAGATGGPSANVIRDIGAGKTLYLHVLVTAALVDPDGTPTMVVTLESDDAAGLDGSATVHWTSPTLLEANMVAGTWIAKGVPIPAGEFQRYLGVRYEMTTADFEEGTVSAWLSENRYDDRTYESGWKSGVN
jgi:hypothetical protein